MYASSVVRASRVQLMCTEWLRGEKRGERSAKKTVESLKGIIFFYSASAVQKDTSVSMQLNE